MAGALRLTGICPVAVQVRDLERSLAFYRDVLGLRLGHGELECRRPVRQMDAIPRGAVFPQEDGTGRSTALRQTRSPESARRR